MTDGICLNEAKHNRFEETVLGARGEKLDEEEVGDNLHVRQWKSGSSSSSRYL
jgi:hypothetical protein